MKIIEITKNEKYMKEYFKLCSLEWNKKRKKDEIDDYANKKVFEIINGINDKVICVLGLINNDSLIGFISLFKYDGDERRDLTPWYATMYVKKEYRGMGYSKMLNDAIIKKAKELGYDKVYLKSDLVNYYERFGAKYIEKLNNGETLYYIGLKK